MTFYDVINQAAACRAGWHSTPSGPFFVFYRREEDISNDLLGERDLAGWYAGIGPAGSESDEILGPYPWSALAMRAAEERMSR